MLLYGGEPGGIPRVVAALVLGGPDGQALNVRPLSLVASSVPHCTPTTSQEALRGGVRKDRVRDVDVRHCAFDSVPSMTFDVEGLHGRAEVLAMKVVYVAPSHRHDG